MTTDQACEIDYIDQEAVQRIQSRMLEDDTFLGAASNFKILGDLTRIKILFALSQERLCVCDLAAILGMTHSAVSHQLRLLRMSNLVTFTKEGKIVYYSLADEHVVALMKMGIEHSLEETQTGEDK